MIVNCGNPIKAVVNESMLMVTRDRGPHFPEGTVVNFFCSSGLVLIGNTSTAICMANGKWDPNPNELTCSEGMIYHNDYYYLVLCLCYISLCNNNTYYTIVWHSVSNRIAVYSMPLAVNNYDSGIIYKAQVVYYRVYSLLLPIILCITIL